MLRDLWIHLQHRCSRIARDKQAERSQWSASGEPYGDEFQPIVKRLLADSEHDKSLVFSTTLPILAQN